MGWPAVLLSRQQAKLARGAKDKEHAMSQTPNTAMDVMTTGLLSDFCQRPSPQIVHRK
jgi:hypothetical protein